MNQKILVPLDGSAFAEQALPWALRIARHTGAELDLVRVHVLYASRTPAPPGRRTTPPWRPSAERRSNFTWMPRPR